MSQNSSVLISCSDQKGSRGQQDEGEDGKSQGEQEAGRPSGNERGSGNRVSTVGSRISGSRGTLGQSRASGFSGRSQEKHSENQLQTVEEQTVENHESEDVDSMTDPEVKKPSKKPSRSQSRPTALSRPTAKSRRLQSQGGSQSQGQSMSQSQFRSQWKGKSQAQSRSRAPTKSQERPQAETGSRSERPRLLKQKPLRKVKPLEVQGDQCAHLLNEKQVQRRQEGKDTDSSVSVDFGDAWTDEGSSVYCECESDCVQDSIMFCECESDCLELSDQNEEGYERKESQKEGEEGEMQAVERNDGVSKDGDRKDESACEVGKKAQGSKSQSKTVTQPPDVAKRLAQLWAKHEVFMQREAGMFYTQFSNLNFRFTIK